jgi:hypothetical protein
MVRLRPGSALDRLRIKYFSTAASWAWKCNGTDAVPDDDDVVVTASCEPIMERLVGSSSRRIFVVDVAFEFPIVADDVTVLRRCCSVTKRRDRKSRDDMAFPSDESSPPPFNDGRRRLDDDILVVVALTDVWWWLCNSDDDGTVVERRITAAPGSRWYPDDGSNKVGVDSASNCCCCCCCCCCCVDTEFAINRRRVLAPLSFFDGANKIAFPPA